MKHQNCPDENGGCYHVEEPHCPACISSEELLQIVRWCYAHIGEDFLAYPRPSNFEEWLTKVRAHPDIEGE